MYPKNLFSCQLTSSRAWDINSIAPGRRQAQFLSSQLTGSRAGGKRHAKKQRPYTGPLHRGKLPLTDVSDLSELSLSTSSPETVDRSEIRRLTTSPSVLNKRGLSPFHFTSFRCIFAELPSGIIFNKTAAVLLSLSGLARLDSRKNSG